MDFSPLIYLPVVAAIFYVLTCVVKHDSNIYLETCLYEVACIIVGWQQDVDIVRLHQLAPLLAG